jgi:flagellar hook-basal body complex protein FliE
MVEAIKPIDAEMKLAQLLGEDIFAQNSTTPAPAETPAMSETAIPRKDFSGNPFEDMLSRAVDALNGVSQSEATTNQLIDKYLKGEMDLQAVMIAQSKTTILVQLAVTTINAAVTSFKEITQMQV